MNWLRVYKVILLFMLVICQLKYRYWTKRENQKKGKEGSATKTVPFHYNVKTERNERKFRFTAQRLIFCFFFVLRK